MRLEIPHKFTKKDAAERVKRLLDDGREKFKHDVEIHEERWENDTLHFDFSAKAQRISGTLAIEDERYVLDARLPLMLRMFEGKIESEMKAQIAKML